MNNLPSSLWKEVALESKDWFTWKTCKQICPRNSLPEPEDKSGWVWAEKGTYHIRSSIIRVLEIIGFRSVGKGAHKLVFMVSTDEEDTTVVARFSKEGVGDVLVGFKGVPDPEPGQDWNDYMLRIQKLDTVGLYFRANAFYRKVCEMHRDQLGKILLPQEVMEALVLIYRDCCPWSFWIMEHMAKLTHSGMKFEQSNKHSSIP